MTTPTQREQALIDRGLGILFRMSLEQTGWRRFFRRWYYADEPLRNDAAHIIEQLGYREPRPEDSRLLR